MCLIIDTCTFHSVFDKNNNDHKAYAPVYDWLISGQGKMIYGGKKYSKELEGKKFLGVLGELNRKGKLVKIPSDEVDRFCKELKKKIPEKAFDDEHIVALVSISKCCLVCTNDMNALPYLKARDLYPKGVKPPKIYRTARNAKLCSGKHIVKICQ